MHKYRTVTLHVAHWRVVLAALRVARTTSKLIPRPQAQRTADTITHIIEIIQEDTYAE